MGQRYVTVTVLAVLMNILAVVGCKQHNNEVSVASAESREAKHMLQGIWIDAETDEVSLRVQGDTIFFPDSTSLPAFFRIVNDSFELGVHHYPIIRQSPYLFWFCNQNGDTMRLHKSDNSDDMLSFTAQEEPKVLSMVTQLQKTDSVVMYGGERYHWYIAINPTKYRVTKSTYNADGVGVENVYYDNIIHISVFHGAQQLYSRDFRKQMYAPQVPSTFLEQAILGNMQFDRVDAQGFHFDATLCIPDGASCYMVSTDISFDGLLSMKLVEY